MYRPDIKHWLAVALMLATAVALSLTSMAKKSATVDEVPHLAAGYSYLMTGDYRMNFEHPPLIKKLAAVPLLLLQPRLELQGEWNQRNEWVFGQRFLYSWNDPDRLIFWGRLPIVLLFVCLGLFVYGCACDFYGPQSGLVALCLYLFTPDLLAHGQLVTTDMGITLFIFAGVYFFYRTLRRPSTANMAGLALSTGLAAVSKYSAVVLALILIILAIWQILSKEGAVRQPASAQGPLDRSQRAQLVGRLALITLATTWLIIWMTYGFRFSILPPTAGQAGSLNWKLFESGLLNRFILFFREFHLLPEAYVYGAAAAQWMMDNRTPYFLGAISGDQWWYFYPVSFTLKTPLPLLLLLLGETVRSIRQRICDNRTVFLLLPVLIYFTIAIGSKIGIGNRHILPIYPFLVVWVSQVGQRFKPFSINVKNVAISALLFWQVIVTLRIYPDFLTYFNEIAGGPKRGYFYLVDSNFDWGQDLKGLAEFRNKHLEEKLYVSYFGMADPSYYLKDVVYLNSYPATVGFDYVDLADVPSGALVAISATKLMSRELETNLKAKQLVEILRVLPPEERIGNSILIYRMP